MVKKKLSKKIIKKIDTLIIKLITDKKSSQENEDMANKPS